MTLTDRPPLDLFRQTNQPSPQKIDRLIIGKTRSMIHSMASPPSVQVHQPILVDCLPKS
jgi:hypothetical protein